jgi:nicotinamide riboside transporter PnuC
MWLTFSVSACKAGDKTWFVVVVVKRGILLAFAEIFFTIGAQEVEHIAFLLIRFLILWSGDYVPCCLAQLRISQVFVEDWLMYSQDDRTAYEVCHR